MTASRQEQSDIGPETPIGSPTNVTRVVGIGSSAGGLEALQVVLRGLRTGLGTCYLVAQHVSPQHRSLMAELLDKETPLVVTVPADGQILLPDHVYVTPPNADVFVDKDRIRLATPISGHGPKPSIDGLFLSLAKQWGSAAVAILLSGTGDDGTYGMREVHAVGGLTVAQDPETAKYQAMPAAAIRAGVTDLIVKPDEIGDIIARSSSATWHREDPDLGSSVVKRVVEQLRRTGAGDFSQYKTGTLQRQIARRMAVLQLSEQEDYLTYLGSDLAESRLLRQSILVSVTAFHRDPQSWNALAEELRQRWHDTDSAGPLRVWVPGCATGEEAVTVAMVVDTVLGHPGNLASRLKIFATDLDEVSLDYARRASYPAQAIASLPQDWRERYFVSRGASVEVSPALRDAMIFARHDIAVDPAFMRLDLVSFRNVLIYFDASLQNRVLRGLHYAMRPEALLFLGRSEGVAGMQEFFAPLSAKHRIFVRAPGYPPIPDPLAGAPTHISTPRSHGGRTDVSSTLREALLRTAVPGAVIVDEYDRVVEIVGEAAGLLSLVSGRFDDRLASLLREDLRVDVRGLVVQARQSGRVAASTISTRKGSVVAVRAIPLVTAAGSHVAVVFIEDEVLHGESDDADSAEPVALAQLRTELAGTREALQATIEELETSNEELQATNEEMTASAEELQASNEELETINEELQATNEELGSLNEELQVRQQELTLANDDLQNIQNALSHAIVIVDRDLRVTRYSPLAVRVFALVDSDIGRVLTHIPATVATGHLATVINDVMETGQRSMVELTGEAHSHLAHVVPYQGADGKVRGAILSITDVTDSPWVGRDDTAELLLLRSMTEGLDEIVWCRDREGRLTFINQAVRDVFGVSAEQAMQGPGALDEAVVDLAASNITSLADPNRPNYLRYQVVAGGVVSEVEDVVHRTIESPSGQQTTIGSIRKVGIVAGLATPDRDKVLTALLSLPGVLVVIVDAAGTVLLAGRGSAELLGVGPDDLPGRGLLGLVHEQDTGAVQRVLSEAGSNRQSEPGAVRVRMISRGGGIRWTDMSIRAADEAYGHFVVSITDVTNDREKAVDIGRRTLLDLGTGLLNRATFIEAVRVELYRQAGRGGRTAVLWVDLDGFKEVNDQHGHSAGDAVLLEVAERLQSACRRHDRIGRLGGDEFGVLITDAEHISTVELTAGRIVEAVAQPIEIDDTSVILGASVGVSIGPQDGTTAEGLLHAADTAMYAAKRGGGGRFQYYTIGLNEDSARRALMRQRLAEAIRAREFTMVYQPIIALVDGSVWGVEALVRWRRDGQLVAAAEFIPTAEQTGQMRHIGKQVLQMVIADLPKLVTMLPAGGKVCVNLSVPELEDPGTVSMILRDVPSDLLEHLVVEVTESVLATEDSQATAAIAALMRFGVAVSVDDFGTGFANFAMLDRFAPDVIKADRSLTYRAVDHPPRGQTLLVAVVALASAVGSVALAEGISSAEHLFAAAGAGVTLGQGYHLGMPMPIEELVEFIAQRDG